MSKNVGRDMDDVPVSGGGKDPRPEDIVDILKLPEKKFVTLRLFGDMYSYGQHWVKGKSKEGKLVNFPKPCLAFDPTTGKPDSTKKCPWCEHHNANEKEPDVRFSVTNYINAIVRQEQKKAPEDIEVSKSEAKTGFKEKDSDSWTPVRAVRVGTAILRQLKDLKQLNTHEDENGDTKAYGVSHPKFGRDIQVLYDSQKAPASQYTVNMGDPKPLKKSEKAYLIWDLSGLATIPEYSEAKAEYEKWAEKMGFKSSKRRAVEDDDISSKKKRRAVEDDDDDEPAPKKKKKVADDDFDDDDPPPKKKKKPADDDDDDDDDDVDLEEDDEDDDPPPKKGKAAKKSSKKSQDEDEEEDEEEEEDDDPPPKKGKAAKKPSKKSRDEDEEEDEEEEEDEDDDPPPKKGKKAPAKKASKKSRDEDEDDDDDEDEEDDDPPSKAKKGAKKPAKRKPADDDDEDDDGDDEDEEDDDDDPPPRKKAAKKPAAKKAAKKRKPADDDDDDDEDEDD